MVSPSVDHHWPHPQSDNLICNILKYMFSKSKVLISNLVDIYFCTYHLRSSTSFSFRPWSLCFSLYDSLYNLLTSLISIMWQICTFNMSHHVTDPPSKSPCVKVLIFWVGSNPFQDGAYSIEVILDRVLE